MSEDGKIVINTGLDMSGLKKDIEELDSVFKNSGMNASLNTLKNMVKSVDESAEKLDKSIDKTAKSMKQNLGTASRETAAELKKTEKASKETGTELDKLGKKGSEVASLLKKGFTVLGGAKVLGWIKNGIAEITEATGSYKETLRGASTLFGDVNVNLNKLSSNMLEMSVRMGMNADELGNSLYSALSAGIPASEDMGEALAFIESSAKTAKGGFTDVNTVVTASASIMNAYGLTVKDVDRIQGILMQTQNKGITTVGELGATLAQVVPTAASLGVSFEQVGAALATMTASGTKTAQATTSLNSMLAELSKNGQQADKNLRAAAEAAGLGERNFQSMIDEGYSIAEILQVMQRYAEANGKTLLDMFGSVEAGRAALQLTSGEAKKFNENLKSMESTAGLVDSAFTTMQTGIDRFKAALEGAKKKIGGEFAPSIDILMGKLADTIAKITGTSNAADTLELAFENLITATANYRQAQENAKESTDDLTQAMLDQSAVAYRVAVQKVSESYSDLAAEAKKYEDSVAGLERQQANNEKGLDNMAKRLGKTRSELAALNAEGKLTWPQNHDFKMYTDGLAKINPQLDEARLNLEGVNAKIAQIAVNVGTAVNDGLVDISSFEMTNKEFYDSVMDVANALKEGEDAAAGFILQNRDNQDALEDRIEALKIERKQVEENSKEYLKLTGELNAVTAAYNSIAIAKGKAATPVSIGDSSSSGDGGSAPAETAVPGLSINVNHAEDKQKIINEIYDDICSQLSAVTREENLFGESANTASKKINILKQGMVDVSAYGEDAKVELEALSFVLGLVEDKMKEADKPFQGLIDYFSDTTRWAQDLSDVLINSLTAGFRTLGKEIGASFEKVKNLEEDINDASDDLLDKQTDLADAQEELNDARARGNEKDIKAGEKKVATIEAEISGLRDVIKAKNEEKKSVKNGEEAWKAFGRTTLSALAQVLYGLGAQLAAQAVALAIQLRWGEAAAATAGSVAAIAAGVGLDTAAGAFEEGGIVPQRAGVPSTGDRHIARVNPGELILNQSQQSNLADQIRAAQQNIAEGRGKSSGESIVVNLAGSQIYGLDEPAVGRAIYENIRTLSSEGVL